MAAYNPFTKVTHTLTSPYLPEAGLSELSEVLCPRLLPSCCPQIKFTHNAHAVCELSPFSHARLFLTPWTVAHQAPPSMGFPRQEYRSGLPCPPPGDLPDPGIKRVPLTSPALADGFFTTSATWEAVHLFLPVDTTLCSPICTGVPLLGPGSPKLKSSDPQL